MNSLAFSVLFVAFLLTTICLKLWLNLRHVRQVLRHRGSVPPDFAEKIPLAAHQKAADYTVAQIKLGLIILFVNSAVLVGFTLLGGLQALSSFLFNFSGPGYFYQICLILGFSLITGLLDLPFDYYSQFVLEEKFGFNRSTVKLWLMDMLKNSLLSLALGLPLLWVVLFLMETSGTYWWLYAWLVLCGFMLLMQMLAPAVIMPLFNKFTPLEDGDLRRRIEGLMQRTGFSSNGLFVMDGSKRSARSNAYFAGFGAKKRIVFYDTLMAQLSPAEIEAVLAHELGHFKLKHIIKRMAAMFGFSLLFLFVLGYLKEQIWFYTGLGVNPLPLAHQNDAMALLLFMLVTPVFLFVLSPLTSISSRKHEFEADAFAAQHANAKDLISALVKMYDENAKTLTPDHWYSTFYDSHPSAAIRIGSLRRLMESKGGLEKP